MAHSDETKAAVISALLEGQGVREVARQFNINPATVIAWRNAAGYGKQTFQPEKKEDIAERVVSMLGTYMETIEAVAAFARDREWLKKQSAAELATFIGVTSDKAFRILAAMEAGEQEQS